jgi:hypothetical protein
VAQSKKVRMDEVTDIKSTAKGTKDPEWWQYREDISSLEDYPDALEYTPDEGESLRKLRVRVTKAAKAEGVAVKHSETVRGTLLVYKPPAEGRTRSRTRKGNSETGAGS